MRFPSSPSCWQFIFSRLILGRSLRLQIPCHTWWWQSRYDLRFLSIHLLAHPSGRLDELFSISHIADIKWYRQLITEIPFKISGHVGKGTSGTRLSCTVLCNFEFDANLFALQFHCWLNNFAAIDKMGFICEAFSCWADDAKRENSQKYPWIKDLSWIKFRTNRQLRNGLKKILRRFMYRFELSRSSHLTPAIYDICKQIVE